MDTKWKKWINTLCIVVVICLMTVGGIFSLNGTREAASLNGGVSMDVFQENGYFTNLYQQGLLFRWAEEQGYTLEDENYHGISDELLDQIQDEMALDADLVIKPYGKKTTEDKTTYGNQKADFQKGNLTQIQVQRDQSEQINRAGQFVQWENGYEGQYDPDVFYQFSGDMMITLPEGLLINGEEGQRLESGTIRIRITQKGMDLIEKEYNKERKQLIRYIKEMVVTLALEVLGIILLIVLFALQKKRTKFFAWLDHIWWEVIAIAGFWIGVGLMGLHAWVWSVRQDHTNGLIDGAQAEIISMICWVLCFALILLFAVCIQTTVWRIKEHKLLDSTLCIGYFRKWHRNAKKRRELEYEAMSFEQQHVKDRIQEYRIARRILIVFIIFGICIMNLSGVLGLGFVILGAVGLKYLVKYSDKYAAEQKDLNKLVEQIDRISNGELTASTDIEEGTIYYDYSQKLSNIGNGMEKALEDQMRNERMKIDLITNVSHDLKTPLTSIIGYVDLLNRDETLSPEAKDYVRILNQKTECLKNIISDLFELAKSTSGNAKVSLEVMDMRRLLEQTLAEMGDKIEASGFQIRFSCKAKDTKFLGDVGRMYRVVQNVLENALKYSLKGTRIFIDITETKDRLRLEVVNTASYEMDFTEEEIMERFARAEKSRTSEGNGLGLSIADSFTKNCGGNFGIEVRGDQFRVEISFQKYTEQGEL